MRLFVSTLILAFATAGLGQDQNPGQLRAQPSPQQSDQWQRTWEQQLQGAISVTEGDSQSGCPVVLTSAQLNWPASYLPVTSAEKVTEPKLALGFSIPSVQPVRSIVIKVRLLVKNDVYQLDANSYDLLLTFSATDGADQTVEQLRELRVPADLHAYGVTRVSLDRVMFTNGDVWSARPSTHCRLDVRGNTERVAK